jgi:hypothetical protein
MWQFTLLARAALRADRRGNSPQPTALRRIASIDGVVLSSGTLFAQGEFCSESVPAEQECYGLCRILLAVR